MKAPAMVRVRILGRRRSQRIRAGFVVSIWASGDRFWSVIVYRNGAIHASCPPRGWWLDFGRPLGAPGLSLRIDVTTDAKVTIEPFAARRRGAY